MARPRQIGFINNTPHLLNTKHQQLRNAVQWRHLVHVIVVQYSVGGEYIGGLLWVMIDYYHIITITLPRNAFRDGINIQQTGVCTSPLMQVNSRVPIFWHRYFDWTLNLQRRHLLTPCCILVCRKQWKHLLAYYESITRLRLRPKIRALLSASPPPQSVLFSKDP